MGISDLMDQKSTTERTAAAIRLLALCIDEQLGMIEAERKHARGRPATGHDHPMHDL